jgi:addiction module RelE/StbE family toxin
MRTISRRASFKADDKREVKTHQKKLLGMIEHVTTMLSSNKTLGKKYDDHKLKGEWQGHRSVRVNPHNPDLVMIYRELAPTRLSSSGLVPMTRFTDERRQAVEYDASPNLRLRLCCRMVTQRKQMARFGGGGAASY